MNLGRRTRDFFLETFDVVRGNLSLGLLSLALAVAVWFFVSDAENTPIVGDVSGVVTVEAVNVPREQAVLRIVDAQVSVRAQADKDVWDKLSAADFRAVVDLSGVNQSEKTLTVKVTANRSDVKVVEVQPSQVTVSLETLAQADLPLRAHTMGKLPDGFELQDVTISLQMARVSGPASLVSSVEAVEADVNVTGLELSMERSYPLVVRYKSGRDVDVRVEPETAMVRLAIVQQDFNLVFIVNPTVSGNVAAGYRVLAVQANPAFVSIAGPLAVLQSINALTTEPVAVDGAQSDVTRSVRLRLPAGARVVNSSEEEVVVSVRVAPAQGQSVLTVAVRTTGLKEGLIATLSPKVINVTVSGLMPVLQALDPASIVARVDLAGLEPGVHTVTPTVDLPDGVTLVGIDPLEITVGVSAQ
jgi:YbbR domain-containing protein